MDRQCALAILAALAMAASVHAATIPYMENFNDNDASDFSDPFNIYTATAQAYTVATGAGVENQVVAPSVVQLTNLGSSDFTISSTFNVAASGQGSVGLALFGNDSSLSGSYYQAYVTRAGTNDSIVLVEMGGDGQINATASTTVAELPLNTAFTFTLSGTRAAGVLTLSFTVSGTVAGNPYSQSISDTDPTPLTGQYFGYRTTRNAGATTATMDDFSVIVPEPASVGLALLGLIAIASPRRSSSRA